MARKVTPRAILGAFNNALSGIENHIDGCSMPVITWGTPIEWFPISGYDEDNSLHSQKRDIYEKRSELIFRLKSESSFEYAIAYAPKIKGKGDTNVTKSGQPKYSNALKCSLCGSGHNWCVFYRTTEGKYLGHSGTECFREILDGLKVSNADAVKRYIKKAENRQKKMHEIMTRISDFKIDFPGLYEHREALFSVQKNPYRRLWGIVMRRIYDRKGVNEKWLEQCDNGEIDINVWDYRNEKQVKQELYVRIPKFLAACSTISSTGSIHKLLEALDKRVDTEVESIANPFRPSRFGRTPQTSPSVNIVGSPSINDSKVSNEEMGRYLMNNGYMWHDTIRKARCGESLSTNEVYFLERAYKDKVAQ